MESWEVDPEGDVILSLSDPWPPFAVWNESQNDLPPPTEPTPLDFEEFIAPNSTYKKGKQRTRTKRKIQAAGSETPPEPSVEPEYAREVLDEPLPPLTLSPSPPPPPVPLTSSSCSQEIAENQAFIESIGHPAAAADHATQSNSSEQTSEVPEPVELLQIRVSSRHIILASSYWDRMLNRDFKEADTLRKSGRVKVSIEDVDAEALLIIMKIIHGRNRDVPKTVDLEMLAKIAVVVDRYSCHEAAEPFTDMWLTNLQSTFPKSYSRDTVLWVLISQVFQQHDLFKNATKLLLTHSCGVIQDMQLPLLQTALEMITEQRQALFEKIVSALQQNAEDLVQRRYGCSFSCRSTQLGSILLAMNEQGLFPSPPTDAPINRSLIEVVRYFENFPSQDTYHQLKRPNHYYSNRNDDGSECGWKEKMLPVLDSCKALMEGLSLEVFA